MSHKEETSTYRSNFCLLLLRKNKNPAPNKIAAPAIPTTTKTPTTAPVLLKNVLPPPELPLPSFKLPVGFLTIWVTVYTTPFASDVTTSEVTVAGTVVTVCPRELVVVTRIAVDASEVTVREVTSAGRVIVDVREMAAVALAVSLAGMVVVIVDPLTGPVAL